MANITTYINKIKNAIYGRDVRDAFISALTVINDDNNSYAALKSEVIRARAPRYPRAKRR